MTFRDDMFSLLFISLVKPQYKMYCDLVDKTGQDVPDDLDAFRNFQEMDDIRETSDNESNDEKDLDEEQFASWCQKFTSFICCRSEDLEQFKTNAHMIGVMDIPQDASESSEEE